MILVEIFNKNSALKFSKNEATLLVANAKIGEYRFRYKAECVANEWVVSFENIDHEFPAGLTKQGNEFEVMACVVKFIRQLVKLKSPNKITFSASYYYDFKDGSQILNDSRPKLYTKMLNRDSFGYKFSFSDDKANNVLLSRNFVLTK